MNSESDLLLTQLAVRLRRIDNLATIGSGVLYFSAATRDEVYIITAAHCLFAEPNSFQEPISEILIDIYDSAKQSYRSFSHKIDYNLVSAHVNSDIAVLIIKKMHLPELNQVTIDIEVIYEKGTATSFLSKGFPNATLGKEIDCVNLSWLQTLPSENKFQLRLDSDYSDWHVRGFSGSGIFLHSKDKVYLYGIFTRYRDEDRGRVVYCQYIETVNELLENNYKQPIPFSFHGENGLTKEFFSNHIKSAIKDLGPRFNAELNFRLPIARRFDEVSKNANFKNRLIRAYDTWIQGGSNSANSKNDEVNSIEAESIRLQNIIHQWIDVINWDSDQIIDNSLLHEELDRFSGFIEKKLDALYEKQSSEIDHSRRRDYSYRPPYELEIRTLRNLRELNSKLFDSISKIDINLANYPTLLIEGDAGSGKSHLLGDIATRNVESGIPTVLLLGQLFIKGQSIWQNIESQLKIKSTQADFLSALDNIGRQVGQRVLILIDALNEGPGKELWFDNLAGFISDVSKYRFVGLVATVRSTFWSRIVPPSIVEDAKITKIHHHGFKGNEYEALRLYCEFHGLQQPNFPILNPEFANPLFLQLICEGIKGSESKTFPQGFQGINQLFSYYIKAIFLRLLNKRDIYRYRKQLVQDAIMAVAKASFFDKSTRVITLSEATALFDKSFNSFPQLLDDLICENVFTLGIQGKLDNDDEVEIVYFAYEKFGDFFIAYDLLESYKTAEDVKNGFPDDERIQGLVGDEFYSNFGILEAMAIVLPERLSLEIFEAFHWITEADDVYIQNKADWMNHALIDSLKWRSVESVSAHKIKTWINRGAFTIDRDTMYYKLMELCTIKDHPFNSYWLHQHLSKVTMPERDAFWQSHIYYYSTYNDNKEAYPIRRLIDWAWQAGISLKVDSETAFLTAIPLSWVLSSTVPKLRDEATIALVNILEQKPDILVNLLKLFEPIDDSYISERLYAVAYGCCLRTKDKEGILKIAEYLFVKNFKTGNPPNHILIRDYARSCIEYALHLNLLVLNDASAIRPPYGSKMPPLLNPEDVAHYELDRDAPDFKTSFGHEQNHIHFEVMSWDFGKKEVDAALRHFNSTSFVLEAEFKAFKKGLTRKQKHHLKLLDDTTYLHRMPEYKKEQVLKNIGQAKYDDLTIIADQLNSFAIESLKAELDGDKFHLLMNTFIPFIKSIPVEQVRYDGFAGKMQIRSWIVDRVFKLGYDRHLHGNFDNSVEQYKQFSRHPVESIGGKYQWIAFYEILSHIADNYKIEDDDTNGYAFYKGPWQLYLRDIDPAFTSTARRDDDSDDDDDKAVSSDQTPEWWTISSYSHWQQDSVAWVSNIYDLPDPRHNIERIDEAGSAWYFLNLYPRWRTPKQFGEDDIGSYRKEIFYNIDAHIIRKTNKHSLIDALNGMDLGGEYSYSRDNGPINMINRENYWAPIVKTSRKEHTWQPFKGTGYKTLIPLKQALGDMSYDRSRGRFYYYMPGKYLMEKMKLQFGDNDGDFCNEFGDVIIKNVSNSGVLIRKDEFRKFLTENKLDVIWTIDGEKRSFGTNTPFLNGYKTFSGLYYESEGQINGTIWPLETH